ncbi:MAG: hypothetical protein OS130_05305 [Thermodesulfobacteriota bacterium]|jgi:hypothetical protein|nr:MAG: hypothetical protein OS130_05305 [Thermodesulfobacteriota bacterium]
MGELYAHAPNKLAPHAGAWIGGIGSSKTGKDALLSEEGGTFTR